MKVLSPILAFSLACASTGVSAQVTGTPQPRPSSEQQERGSTPDTAAIRRRAEQQLGRNISQADIIEQLRSSGMSRAQVRARLQQAGYDPSLADQYFDMMDRGTEAPKTPPSESFLRVLSEIGLGVKTKVDANRDSLLFADSLSVKDTMPASRRVFGRSLFQRVNRSEFDPALSGPVDPGYRLGPGDQIGLVLTGDLEEAYSLEVTREGIIFVPDVGQISVNGLTLAGLEDVLYQQLGRVYSGISRSPDASTRFHVTLGRLRTNQVFVIGEVEQPGAYQVSSVGRVLNALYQAGGPTESGSFRRIEIHRGDGIVGTFDLYDYLLRGSAAADIRLEQNDRIFVPPAGPQVRIEGSVTRPGIYEMRGNEGLADLITFAGGPTADAVMSRIQIERILPPSQRQPGLVRVTRDVDPRTIATGALNERLEDGDIVHVFEVNEETRNRVWLLGEVRNPGTFEWRPGTTLWQVVNRADGLSERAYTPRAQIYRLNPLDNTRRLVTTDLFADAAGRPTQDMVLEDRDSIVVLSREELANEQFVAINGFIRHPDRYPHAVGGTAQDLVLRAGGFMPGAYMVEAEIYRLRNPLVRDDTTSTVIHVQLVDPATLQEGQMLAGGVPEQWSTGAQMILQPGDRMFIRKAPGFEAPREVHVVGEVPFPGTYVLKTRNERLTDLLARAGGLTTQAYPQGMRVVRDGRIVAADLASALERPDDRNNILLEARDSIYVPPFDPTVTVTGAVAFEARALYREGRSLDWYLEQAGGAVDEADRGRITVTYPNGERARARGTRFWRRYPEILPGSNIFVPAKPEDDGQNFDAILSRSLTALSTVLTLVVIINQMK